MPYHKYVFDKDKRKFIGEFEEMYRGEDRENYNSWHQEDIKHFTKLISCWILERYNFNKILDLGCGKGAFTRLLKKENNQVVGVDVSKTAIKKATAQYPSIKFMASDIQNYLKNTNRRFDMVVLMEILSYIKNWKKVIKEIATLSKYIYITLYIPNNPIGYVKSFTDLRKEIKKYFEIKIDLIDNANNCIFLLCIKENKK